MKLAAAFAARAAWRATMAGFFLNSSLAISSSMRVMSIWTMRPAPMLRWPTSLLPIWPSGRPTKCSEARISVLGNSREQLVVGGLAGQSDGVVGGFSTVAPSVKDGENERTLGHEEDTSIRNVVFSSRINCRAGGACGPGHAPCELMRCCRSTLPGASRTTAAGSGLGQRRFTRTSRVFRRSSKRPRRGALRDFDAGAFRWESG